MPTRTKQHQAHHAARRAAPVAALVAAAGMLLALPAAAGTIDPTDAGPPLKGWGTSLAWWANITGRWNDPAQFEALMDDVFNVEDGLGLTIVRLNIGAGQRPDLSVGGYMTPGRLMPSYKDGPDEQFFPLADRAQTRVLMESIERGVQYVEANGNSPPWWMTVTQDSSGNPNGPNITPDRYDDFAAYLADVALWYRVENGVTFNSLTPLNEPSATWWDGNGNQEGCTIPPSEHPALLAELRAALDARGLQDIPVSGPEEWSTNQTLSNLTGVYPNTTLEQLSHIATHSYNTQNRAGLNAWSEAYDKPLWMSEYGTGAENEYASAIQLARRIIGDFREMPNLEAWVIWQVMSTNHFQHTWSCMLANFATVTPEYTFRPQYFTFANFSRFIRPGSRMIDSGDSSTLAAFHPARQRLVIVALNDSTSARLGSFNLSAFDNLPSSAAVHRTSRTEDLKELPPLLMSGPQLSTVLAPESVTTFVIDGVSTPALPRTDWDADGRLTQNDPSAFIEAQSRRADETDINLDGTIDFFDTLEFLKAHDAASPGTEIARLTFAGVTGGSLNETVLGNGASGGAYFADNRLFIQAFAAEAQEGGIAIPLSNITIEAGKTYDVRVRAADFNQGWTIGGSYAVGLSTTLPTITTTPDLGDQAFNVSRNNGPGLMTFTTHDFSFTAASAAAGPYLFIRTNDVASGNQRVAIESVSIVERAGP